MSKRISDIKLIFSTPIWTSIIPNYKEINNKMLSYIESLKLNDPAGRVKSNLIGWHSQNFNLKDDEPQLFVNEISVILNESINDMGWDLKNRNSKITGMWAIINPTNASNARHIHSNNFISAAYYLKAPENCGDITFYDPRSAKVINTPKISSSNNLNIDVVNVTPKEGLLVLFPSYLHHSVGLNKSKQNRIVISFNINIV
tara:strand:+ start:289 stop:891 length:603 start_codon:yes stop_codon:yes gene_type:complete